MKYLIGGLATVAIFALAATLFFLGGVFNVAATDQHAAITRWTLHTAMERSVRSHATEVAPPDAFTPQQAAAGFSEFNEMCVGCHGAPGKERGEVGKGLNPQPPDLSKVASRFSKAELFWILKHGVKMTGMPAFGPTHSDDRLWSITAFLEQLPQVTPEQYAAKAQAAEKSGVDQHGAHSDKQEHHH